MSLEVIGSSGMLKGVLLGSNLVSLRVRRSPQFGPLMLRQPRMQYLNWFAVACSEAAVGRRALNAMTNNTGWSSLQL